MKRITPLLLVLLACTVCRAQDEEQRPGKVSQAYHESRKRSTTPPYGIQKIQGLIPNIREVPDKDNEDAGLRALSEKTYASLSLREKFTYNMIQGESYFQGCDVFMPYIDEEKKVFARLPDAFSEKGWSKRQRKFFLDNKDSVISLMTESIGRTHYVGLNYKHVIVDINATEMIPFLIDFYKIQRKDHDILTVLLLLMYNNKYPPFMASPSYKKLYANEGGSYEAYLVCNAANQDLIIQRATEFYNGLHQQ
jgi:hypothetical protein